MIKPEYLEIVAYRVLSLLYADTFHETLTDNWFATEEEAVEFARVLEVRGDKSIRVERFDADGTIPWEKKETNARRTTQPNS